MRRGLMRWEKDELPEAALLDRIARLQAAMAAAGLDGFAIYTNLVQPSAVTFLTGFTPYWSDGLLLLPKSGAPVFATALSKRVAGWISSTNPVSEVVNTPKPGAAVGRRLAADGCRRVGVLELDRLPGGLYDEIAAAAPAIELVDASAIFAQIRRPIDAAERRLIERADAIAVAALAQVDAAPAADAGAAAGRVEEHARLAGAEEAYIAVAADLASDRRLIRATPARPLAETFALRASIAYKGSWVRRTRTFARDPARRAAVARADDWFKAAAGAIEPGKPIAAQLAARIGALAGARIEGFLAERSIGSYPLEVIASSRDSHRNSQVDPGFLVLTLGLTVDGMPWLGAMPIFA
jgi:Xaa-Pro aminopeptidase